MIKCEICGKEFEKAQQLAGHKTSKHIEGIYNKISKKTTLQRIKIIKKCIKCDKYFEIERKIKKDGKQYIDKKEKKYCSRTCANSHIQTDEIKEKIRKNSNPWNKGNKRTCDCGNKIQYSNKTGKCNKCLILIKKKPYDKNSYKYQCRFSFDIYSYPGRFDLSLVNKYGWFKPTNYKEPNLNGVSLDHMYSIDEGYKNKIDPEIIKHPANCALMLHRDNKKKGTNSSITIEELKIRIDNW